VGKDGENIAGATRCCAVLALRVRPDVVFFAVAPVRDTFQLNGMRGWQIDITFEGS
jgi:hypothetical protein